MELDPTAVAYVVPVLHSLSEFLKNSMVQPGGSLDASLVSQMKVLQHQVQKKLDALVF